MFIDRPKTKLDWIWLTIFVSLIISTTALSIAYANSLEIAKTSSQADDIKTIKENQKRFDKNIFLICDKLNANCIDAP